MRYRTMETVEAFQVPFPITLTVGVDEREGEQTANAGDWIVRYTTGEIGIVPDERFKRLYEAPEPPKKVVERVVEKEYVPYPVPYPARPYPWSPWQPYEPFWYVSSQRTASGELPVKFENVTSSSTIRLLAQSATNDTCQPGGPAVAR